MATSITSSLTSNSGTRELCLYCKKRPYDIVCVCGDKFDYSCIQRHTAQLTQERDAHHEQIEDKLMSMSSLPGKDNHQADASRALINQWRRKRLHDINAIADGALEDHAHPANISFDTASFQEEFKELSTGSPQVSHDYLDKLIELKRQIQERLDSVQKPATTVYDEAALDALLQSKLQPSEQVIESSSRSSVSEKRTNQEDSPTISFRRLPSASHTETPAERSLYNLGAAASTEEMRHNSYVQAKPSMTNGETLSGPILENRDEIASREEFTPSISTSTPLEQPLTNGYHETPAEAVGELTNTTNEADVATEYVNDVELEAGLTSHIQRHAVSIIPASSDRFAGTVCSHGDQLLYNTCNGPTESWQLILVPDIADPKTTRTIDWTAPSDPADVDDNAWIQDIAYCEERGGYLILNRARLRLYKDDTNELQELRTFPGRTMKRVSCYGRSIYLTAMHPGSTYNGDELIVRNTDQEEEVCKTLRDILPARINRGAGPLAGEISDIAVANNELVIIGYRLERRHEVGVCIFNLAQQGKEWTCAKHLLLNECWHNDLSYTPRMEWCEKLQACVLVEHMTGHLIMIDRDGQVEGECSFTHARNRRDTPINLTISTNDWLCVRYSGSIVIHKISD